MSLDALASLVDQAHATLSSCIQTAALLLREPNFSWKQDYGEEPYGLSSLVLDVVFLRIVAVRSLCRAGLGSEEAIADVLLTSIIPILLECENITITENYEALDWKKTCGQLFNLKCPKTPPQYALHFLDNLARQRDQLWIKERTSRNPKILGFNKGWPRGLPIQSLFPSRKWTAAAVSDADAAPFTAARVKDVVFCDPGTVLATVLHDNTTRLFVDNLLFAIYSYIGDKDQTGCDERLLEVWNHYSSPVWTNTNHIAVFKMLFFMWAKGNQLAQTAKVIGPPVYMTLDYDSLSQEGAGPVEWDPRPNRYINTSGHTESTVQQTDSGNCSLLQYRFQTNEKTSITDRPQPWKDYMITDIRTLWKPAADIRKLPYLTQEAMALSALLYLDSLCTGSPRLLSKPFPQTAAPFRYPALYLDYEFLSELTPSRDTANSAIKVLRQLVRRVPPVLIHEVASSLLKTLLQLPYKSPKHPDLIHTTMHTIALLPLTDRPELGVDLGLKVIETLPDASAWYRQVVTLSLLRQLIPESAERFVRDFAAYISIGLENQQATRKAQIAAATGTDDVTEADKLSAVSTTPATAVVKITTIKLFSRLLTNNNFAPFKLSLDILHSLFTASDHIDVRRKVVDSILVLLKKSREMQDEACNEIYATFKSFSMVAARPSERDVVSEDTWLKAEAGGPLPEVNSHRPLLELFIKKATDLVPRKHRADYCCNVILPLIDESNKQHSRWMRIYLGRLELTPDEASVKNFGPFGDYTLRSVFEKWLTYLPSSFLPRYRASVLSYVDCLKLENINSKLDRQDKNWRETSEGKHWSHYFEYRSQDHTMDFEELIARIIDPNLDGAIITREQLVDEYCAWIAIIIRNPFEFKGTNDNCRSSVSLGPFRSFAYLPMHYTQPLHPESIRHGKYLEPILPLFKRIVADVESLRNEDWLGDPNRSPVILPSILHLQCPLLPYPHLHNSDSQRYEKFAKGIDTLVKKFAESASCVSDFPFLIKSMSYVQEKDKVPCAVAIGGVADEDHIPPAGYLRLQLARTLIDQAEREDRANSSELRKLIKRWKGSPNEWLRSAAWEVDPTR